MKEVWKDLVYIDTNGEIIEFDGFYQVSNLGRIRSFRAHGGSVSWGKRKEVPTLLKQRPDKNGYYSICLTPTGNTTRRVYLVHRIVCSTFISIPSELTNKKIQVNHKDENKGNNCVENLEWCTPLENTNYGSRTKRATKNSTATRRTEEWKEKHSGGNVHNARAVVGISVSTGEVIEFEAMQCVDNYFKIPLASRSVSATIRGRQKTAYGYKWYYKEDYEKLQNKE